MQDFEIDGNNLFEIMLLSSLDPTLRKVYKICRKYGIKTKDFIPFTMEIGMISTINNEENKDE